jgi:hypothetical protein
MVGETMQEFIDKKREFKRHGAGGGVAHTYSPSNQEAEVGESQV